LDSIEKVYQYLPYHAYCIQDSGLDLAIFSRYPILTHRAIEVGADGSHALWCDLDIRGKRIRIYNCHLQTTNFNQTRFNNSAGLWFWNYKAQVKKTDKLVKTIYQNTVKRNAQIREIDHHVRECAYPVIVCGDFNSTPASYAYDLVQRHLTDGFRQTGRGYAYTYNRLHKLFRIDYIFYSTQFSGQRYWSVNNGLSDHNPVMMSIRL
jgi:endonuclease/exonuclease/phosphatase family metal-dependent hydrolase